jgi:hypothetical protein
MMNRRRDNWAQMWPYVGLSTLGESRIEYCQLVKWRGKINCFTVPPIKRFRSSHVESVREKVLAGVCLPKRHDHVHIRLETAYAIT